MRFDLGQKEVMIALLLCIIVILQVLFIIRHVLVEKKLLISTNTVSLHK